jgi:hypothetical protein
VLCAVPDLSLKRSSARLGRGACLGKLRPMLNRRKAMIGYLAYVVGKPMAKRAMKKKAKAAKPPKRARISGAAVAAGIGAAAGALFFWRKRRGGSSGEQPPPS